MWSRPATTSSWRAEGEAGRTLGREREAGRTFDPGAGTRDRCPWDRAIRCAPALPELAIATGTTVAIRCAPALPELAIATGGNLDISSCVYRKDLAPRPMIDEP
jgi:hypothetical protein